MQKTVPSILEIQRKYSTVVALLNEDVQRTETMQGRLR
jgi:hypothetical protein